MSRPCPSVPSRNSGRPPSSQAGGRKASDRLKVTGSKGVCGAMSGASTAPSTASAVTAAAATVTGELVKLW